MIARMGWQMRLHDDWHRILKKAWSIRLAAIAGVLSAAEVVLPMFGEDIPRNLFAILSTITITAAMVARLVAQKEMQP